MNVFIRYPDRPNPTYYARWTGPDGTRYLRNTSATSKAAAEKILLKLAAAAAGGRFDVLEATKARQPAEITIGKIIEHYEAGAREITEGTRAGNIYSIRNLVRRALKLETDAEVDSTPLQQLTGDLVFQFRQAVLDAAEEEEADDVRGAQLQRSANSILRQGRSLFTPNMLSYYKRAAQLTLPATLRDFCDEPGFRGVTKTDYNKPDDKIIARTFKDLPDLEAADPNLYRAIWAALGFGLRKSEISAARVAWFIQRDGTSYLRGDVLDKSGKIPDILGQFGAAAKLAPHLDRAAEKFLLEGNDTERKELVFRRAGEWMAERGWGTQKRIHEFRAWAICQVAQATGNLIEAQKWARHASYSTTEKNYGRYITAGRTQVALVVPTGEFKPAVAGAGAKEQAI